MRSPWHLMDAALREGALEAGAGEVRPFEPVDGGPGSEANRGSRQPEPHLAGPPHGRAPSG